MSNSFVSAYSLSNNLHSVLECLYALRQTIDDLILLVESFIHFSFQVLSKSHELSHCLLLELFNILVLHFELLVAIVFECAQLQRLIGPFLVNFLL